MRRRSRRDPTTARSRGRRGVGSDDELARSARQVPRAILGDDEHVLEPDAADLGVVDPRLDRHDVTRKQRRGPRPADRWRLMDLEADTMTGPVDEATRHRILGIVLLAIAH